MIAALALALAAAEPAAVAASPDTQTPLALHDIARLTPADERTAPAAPAVTSVTPLPLDAVTDDGRSLTELVASLRSQNLELAASRERLGAIEGLRRQAGAWPNPRLELNRKSDSLGTDRGKGELEVNLVQPIELAGIRRARKGLAQAQGEATSAEVAALEQRLVAELRLSVAQALAESRKRDAAVSSHELATKLERAVALRAGTGEASRFDLALASAETARLASERARADARVGALFATVRLLAGLGPSEPLQLRAADLVLPPLGSLDAVALQDEASRTRAELAMSRAEVRIAESELAAAQAAAWPELDVLVGYKEDRAGTEAGAGPDLDRLVTFGGAVTLPIFNRHRGDRVAATARLAAARQGLAAAEAAVRRDVMAALARVEASERALAQARDRLAPESETAVRAARVAYEAGAWPIQQLVAEERRALESQAAVADAQLDAFSARIELDRAVGTDRFTTGAESTR